MKEIYDFLKACPCYFIATIDDYPSLRAMYDENDEGVAGRSFR